MRWFPDPKLPDKANYTAAIASLLSDYPYEVAHHVCGPKGIATRIKFFPSLAEIREACEAEVEPMRRLAAKIDRNNEMQKTLAGPEPATQEERDRAVARWEAQRTEMETEDRERRAKADAERRARLVEVADRMRDRELKQAGIEDGLPIGLELRKKLEAMGARFPALTGGPSDEAVP